MPQIMRHISFPQKKFQNELNCLILDALLYLRIFLLTITRVKQRKHFMTNI